MLDVVLITGPAGAGKTSTAEAWAASRACLCVHLSHDAVHLLLKSGAISPAEHPGREAERQWRIALDVCVAACRVYAASGVRCAIDTFLLPATLPLWAGLRGLRVGIVVLHPDVTVAVQRNAARLRNGGHGVPEWQVRANHAAMGAWTRGAGALLIDNTHMDVAQTVAAIDHWEDSLADYTEIFRE